MTETETETTEIRDEDDVQGHRRARAMDDGEDDVQGHRRARAIDDGEDDVEGHRRSR